MADTSTSTSAIALHFAAFAGQLDLSVVRDYASYAHAVDVANADIARIEQSPDLTPMGRAKKAAARRAEASKALNPLRATIQRTQSRLNDTERAALPPWPLPQDPATIARDPEIRDRLMGKESLEVWQLAIDAVERGDDDFLRAVEQAPRAFPLLAPDHAAYVRQMRLERSPVASELAILRHELEIHEAMLQAALHDLQITDGPVDTTATLAATGT